MGRLEVDQQTQDATSKVELQRANVLPTTERVLRYVQSEGSTNVHHTATQPNKHKDAQQEPEDRPPLFEAGDIEGLPAASDDDTPVQRESIPGAFGHGDENDPRGSLQIGDDTDQLIEAMCVNEEEERAWKQMAADLQRQMDDAPRAKVVVDDGHDDDDPIITTKPVWSNKTVCLGAILLLILVVAGAGIVVEVFGSSKEDSIQSTQDTTAPAPTTIEAAIPTSAPPIRAENLPPTLQGIEERGLVRCRVDPDDIKSGHGFSINICRAIAAGILGDANKTQLVPLQLQQAFEAVANGSVDASTGFTAYLSERDIHREGGMRYSTPFLYTGSTFAGITEYVECAERGQTLLGVCRNLKVCVVPGSAGETVLKTLLDGSAFHYVDDSKEVFQHFRDGDCNVFFNTVPVLSKVKGNYTGPYKVSQNLYSYVSFAIVTRNDDDEFGDMVNWLLESLIVAEALNITKESADQFPQTDLFGAKYKSLFRDAIAAVGNFGESYWIPLLERMPRQPINTPHLGPQSGGLLYPFAFGKVDQEFAPDDVDTIPKPNPNGTLDQIEHREVLYCGIIRRPAAGLAEWNATSGQFSGLDVDYCIGLAASLFAGNTDDKSLVLVEYQNSGDAFADLAEERIDVLAGAEYTMINDVKEPTTGHGFAFGTIYYYLEKQEDKDDNESGEENKVVVVPLAMATREGDAQWTDFVRLITVSTIHAEANNITRVQAGQMPTLEVFGPRYRQSLRDTILSIGNYAEMYNRNVERYQPRFHNPRNTLNSGSNPMFFVKYDF